MKYKVFFKVGAARASTICDSKQAAEKLSVQLGSRYIRMEEYAG